MKLINVFPTYPPQKLYKLNEKSYVNINEAK